MATRPTTVTWLRLGLAGLVVLGTPLIFVVDYMRLVPRPWRTEELVLYLLLWGLFLGCAVAFWTYLRAEGLFGGHRQDPPKDEDEARGGR